eukprot:gene7877-9696_t
MGGAQMNCTVDQLDFKCSFCATLMMKSFPLFGTGDSSIAFHTLLDITAIGYIISALYLFFRIQRSYSYLQHHNLNTSSRELTQFNFHNNSSKLRNVNINKSNEDILWDKNMGITINKPKIINTTYFKHLLFVALWLSFEGLILLFLPLSSIAYPTVIIIVGCGHIITDNWVLIFLGGKEDDKHSARRSFYICALLYLLTTSTTLASYFDGGNCKAGSACQILFYQDPFTVLGGSLVALIVYTVILTLSFKREIIRATGKIWLIFQISSVGATLISSILLIFKIDLAYCFIGMYSIGYAFSYGFLLFLTCGNDSNLLRARSEFLPLLTNFQEYTSLFGGNDITITSGEGASTALQLSAFYIRYNEFKFGQIVGQGYFGEVRKAIWKGAMVAVKILHRNTYRNTDNTEENVFLKEVAILSLLRHPNVVQFLGVCSESNQNCIVTEYMGGGSLDRMLQDRYFLIRHRPEFAWKISLDIAKGMFYLHDWKPNPILHRDLSTKNILLDESCLIAKVADFGLSKEQGFEMTASVGYLPFQAPEVFIGELYTSKADVYSYGILLWCILTGEQPNQNLQPLKMAHLVAYENYRPPLPTLQSPLLLPLLNLVQLCWKTNPEERPTFSFILDYLEANIPSMAPFNGLPSAPSIANPHTSIAISSFDTSSGEDDDQDNEVDELFSKHEAHYIGD